MTKEDNGFGVIEMHERTRHARDRMYRLRSHFNYDQVSIKVGSPGFLELRSEA